LLVTSLFLAVPAVPTLARGAEVTSPSGEAAESIDRKAAARALFEEGLAHADAQRWAEAADRFERASALRPSPVITYNLTSALVRLGDLVRAVELLREIEADPRAAAEVRQAARARLGEVRPRLAHLRVEAPRQTGHLAVAVLVDGHPLDDARLGAGLPVNPTAHSIELRTGTTIVGSRQVSLREGERRTVSVGAELPPAAHGQAAAAGERPNFLQEPPGESGSLAASREGSKSYKWAWVALGAVAVGVATAAVIATRGDSTPMGNVGTWNLGGQ
jgi:tetratricopeptide (TPR) repeat protein